MVTDKVPTNSPTPLTPTLSPEYRGEGASFSLAPVLRGEGRGEGRWCGTEAETQSPAATTLFRLAWVLLVLLSTASVCPALEPVPETNRIPATIAGTLAAPADSPMHMPTDVAVDRTGQVFVADGTNNRIVVFHPDGTFDRSITTVGEEKLNRPVGLCVDLANRLWIADSGNHRLLLMASDGQLAARVDVAAPEDGRPPEPTGVAVASDGRRTYFTDNHNHRIGIRDNVSGAVTFLGRFGEGLGQFRWPFMVAVAPDGYVYITEAIGARTQRLSPADRWAGQLGRSGVELGQFYRPKGVVVDAQGRPYISDSTLAVVQVFGPLGGVVGVLTDPTGRPLKFQHPMGMAFGPSGQLYVVELLANRVAIVNLPPDFTSKAPVQPATRPEAHTPR